MDIHSYLPNEKIGSIEFKYEVYFLNGSATGDHDQRHTQCPSSKFKKKIKRKTFFAISDSIRSLSIQNIYSKFLV